MFNIIFSILPVTPPIFCFFTLGVANNEQTFHFVSFSFIKTFSFQVASGEKLPVTQDDLKAEGHSFEARIYAEDPDNKFMPGAGPLNYIFMPSVADNVRIETGIRQGAYALIFNSCTPSCLVTLPFNENPALSVDFFALLVTLPLQLETYDSIVVG